MHTFADPLRRALQVAPHKIGLIDGERRFSFSELHERCMRLAAALYALGLRKGDRVAILAPNSHVYMETYLAVPASGLVVVPLNTRHANPELRYALEDSATRVLITDRDAGELADCVERVVNFADYESLLSGHEPLPLGRDVTENDLAGLFYTGGTTGKSKGVMLSHRNLIANTFHWLMSVPHSADDVELVMAPMFHAAGSNGILGAVWNTTAQVTLGAFAPDAALDIIATHGVTHTLAVPTMLSAMAELQHEAPRAVDSLKFIAHGGSPVATEVLRRSHSAFPATELVEVYGSTELSPLITALRNEQTLLETPRARSCGQSIPGAEVQVLSATGEPLPPGEVGEVVARGPNVMQGYWNKAEQTAAVLKDGAYWTGDLGYFDDEGYLFLVDRSKDMIVTGGENVYSTEVEEALFRHPAVLEAAAFGVPDKKWGEAVHAVVVPRSGHEDVDPADIIEFCHGHIAGYKVPKAIDIRREPLPKSGPGKILKRELRAPFWDGVERGVN